MQKTTLTFYEHYKTDIEQHHSSILACINETSKIPEAEHITSYLQKILEEAGNIITLSSTLITKCQSDAEALHNSLEKIKATYNTVKNESDNKEMHYCMTEEQINNMRNKILKKEDEINDLTKDKAELQKKLNDNEDTILNLKETCLKLKEDIKSVANNFIEHTNTPALEKSSKVIIGQVKLNNELSKENSYVIEEVESSLCNDAEYNNTEQCLLKDIFIENESLPKEELMKCWKFIATYLHKKTPITDIVNIRINSLEEFQRKLNSGNYYGPLYACMLIVSDVLRELVDFKSVFSESTLKNASREMMNTVKTEESIRLMPSSDLSQFINQNEAVVPPKREAGRIYSKKLY